MLLNNFDLDGGLLGNAERFVIHLVKSIFSVGSSHRLRLSDLRVVCIFSLRFQRRALTRTNFVARRRRRYIVLLLKSLDALIVTVKHAVYFTIHHAVLGRVGQTSLFVMLTNERRWLLRPLRLQRQANINRLRRAHDINSQVNHSSFVFRLLYFTLNFDFIHLTFFLLRVVLLSVIALDWVFPFVLALVRDLADVKSMFYL